MRLYLIRHGQSFNNTLTPDTYHLRHKDPDLTDIGQQQAAAIADYLSQKVELPGGGFSKEPIAGAFGITHLYCSPMRRAMQTTAPIAKALDITPAVWVDIHEQGGIWLRKNDDTSEGYPGMNRAAIEAEFPEYQLPDDIDETGWWHSDGHEKTDVFLGRVLRVAYALQKRADTDDVIVLVSHAAFLSILIKGLLGQLPRQPGDPFYAHYNTGITRFDFDDGIDKIRLHYLNRVEHLPADLRTW